MNVLFDQNVPRNLRRHLAGHRVNTALEMRWDRTVNGALIKAAEAAGFDVFVTGDRNLAYQQNLANRKIAIIELTDNKWPLVRPHVTVIAAAVDSCVPGGYITIRCGNANARNPMGR